MLLIYIIIIRNRLLFEDVGMAFILRKGRTDGAISAGTFKKRS